MKPSDALKNAGWAAAGAVLLGGGVFLGLVSATLRRRTDEAAGFDAGPTNQEYRERLAELTVAVAEIEQRMEARSPGGAAAGQWETVSARVEQLEKRVEQLVSEAPSIPPVDQVLAAVEQMVAAKIGGLDERLTDQVHAIEMLRNASTQTDVLLHKLIHAVEALAEQAAEKTEANEVVESPPTAPPKDYPVA